MSIIEELESHILCLKEALEVEVELFGSRTHMACALRTNIINSEKELESLKTVDEEMFGKCDYCEKPYLLCGNSHNTETGNHHECEGLKS